MIHSADKLLDVMKVPVSGDPTSAVLAVDHREPHEAPVACDILVVGGGLGGVAAASAAARRGRRVCLLEETDWLGGQITAQGVSALDEHDHIESFGGTRSYYQLRDAIRDHYRALLEAPPREPFNPGNCWVTRLAFEPKAGLGALNALLAPEIDSGYLRIFPRCKASAVETEGDRIIALRALDLETGRHPRFEFDYVLDATELGDLLALSNSEYVVGAESIAETSEPHAQPEGAKSHCVQSCTYIFALERRAAGESHVIAEPEGYAHYLESQPYSFKIHVHGGEIYGEETGWLQYQLFEDMPGTKGPLWKYRRLIEAGQFPGSYANDLTMFNWPGTDYRDRPLVDLKPEELAAALRDAKRVSLGFIHWLQTAAPNPSGAPGFPELMLRPDVMGSIDGLSKYPYIRECRRIKALKTITEQDVAVAHQPGPRAAHFADSIGVGWYPIDIHQAGAGDVGVSTRTKPFQIPLGALIPERLDNLIAANKNIGTTHITNGCYRLHPVEWNIGEAASALAAQAIESGRKPRAIHADPEQLRALQADLLGDGVPICWLIDVPHSSADFSPVQRLAMAAGYADKGDQLTFAPTEPLPAEARGKILAALAADRDPCGNAPVSRAAFAAALAEAGLT
ncbi:MAG: FAD-dependent oxidoreductase [Alphaproteobacteria bacterium]|jgi:hypothetical protein|nr:FAD-dependent oxidoreductase [Alphaproteobacteria bacterium]MDP6819548.1 FAD-dependent oxidoreductase [Alphaproteobacteria bacterium]